MFMYACADLLGFQDRNLIESVLEGNMPMFGPTTQELRLGIAVIMSIPALMVFTSVAARIGIARWANVIAGVFFSLAIISTMLMDSPLYYVYCGLLEFVLTTYVGWAATRWPRRDFAR